MQQKRKFKKYLDAVQSKSWGWLHEESLLGTLLYLNASCLVASCITAVLLLVVVVVAIFYMQDVDSNFCNCLNVIL